MDNTLFERNFDFLASLTTSKYFFARARRVLSQKGIKRAFELLGKKEAEEIGLSQISYMELLKLFKNQGIDMAKETISEDQKYQLQSGILRKK